MNAYKLYKSLYKNGFIISSQYVSEAVFYL